jgi:hypothetical protein
MNVSMTYPLLPDFATRNDIAPPRYSSYNGDAEQSSVDSSPRDLVNTGKRAYKYYVLSEPEDLVYTRTKNTERLVHSLRGSIVDLYA